MSDALHLFQALGIELEYMLVRTDTLDVLPAVDKIFREASGAFVSDYEDGPITWSNELALHVMEIKVTNPVASWSGLSGCFQAAVQKINNYARKHAACLLPTAIHPWMDPRRETELWPHEYAEVYQTFHRIFDCHRHGWANLQSVHLNLPFCGDEEFARLHAAVRLVLPLLPGLAASSPVVDGRITGHLDNRLDVYINNSRIIPHITGDIVPEPVFTRREYEKQILLPMYEAIAPHDPDGILQDEFLNARGAIARFGRGSIEIRLLDVQECPAADLAIADAVIHAVKRQVREEFIPLREQQCWSSGNLRSILVDHARSAEHAVITDAEFLSAWGLPDRHPCASQDVWRHILADYTSPEPELGESLSTILDRGTLATRMLTHLPPKPDRSALADLYHMLAQCLAEGRMLH